MQGDGDAEHPEGGGAEGDDGSRNFVYLDGHVDAVILADDQETQTQP